MWRVAVLVCVLLAVSLVIINLTGSLIVGSTFDPNLRPVQFPKLPVVDFLFGKENSPPPTAKYVTDLSVPEGGSKSNNFQYLNLNKFETSDPEDSTRYFFVYYQGQGLGDFLLELINGFYVCILSHRFLLIRWPSGSCQEQQNCRPLFFDLFVPRLIAWNISEIDRTLLPPDQEDDSKCVVRDAYSNGYHPRLEFLFQQHPGHWDSNEIQNIAKILELSNFGQDNSTLSRHNFPQANAVHLPYGPANLLGSLEIQSDEQFRVTQQSGAGGPLAQYADLLPHAYRTLDVPSELEVLLELSNPMGKFVERIILRTFFLIDDPQFEVNLDYLGHWQREMFSFMTNGTEAEISEKRKFSESLVDGLSETIAFGIRSHCKRLSLVGNILEKINFFGTSPLASDFRKFFSFHLIVADVIVDPKPPRKKRNSKFIHLKDLPKCLTFVDQLGRELAEVSHSSTVPRTELIFFSNAEEAQKEIFKLRQGSGVIVPQVAGISQILPATADSNLGLWTTQLMDFLFLVMADAMVVSESNLGLIARNVNNKLPVVCCGLSCDLK